MPAEFSDLINAADNPAAANAFVSAVLDPEIPRPVMPEPEDDQVRLPGGITLDGQLRTTARVRELTGAVEEEMARAAASATPERMLTVLLTGGLVDVGGVPADPALVDRLLLGDRDAIVLGIRRMTYGSQIDFERYVCVSCASEFALTIGLDEIPVVWAENPGTSEITVPLKRGRTAKVRLTNGADQIALMAASRTGKPTPADQDTLHLSRCVLSITDANGNTRLTGGDKQAMRDLPMADRHAILKALTTKRPGPRMDEVKVTCPDCAHTQEIAIGIEVLFRG